MSDREAVPPFLKSKGEVKSIIPYTRKEMFLAYAAGEDVDKPTPITREEYFLNYLGDSSASIPKPVTRIERFIAKVHNESIETPEPVTRVERILAYITDDNVDVPDPRTREEIFLLDAANYIKQHSGSIFTLSYYNYDGSVLLYSERVRDGADGAGYKGTTPSKPDTAQYTYSFIGWNTSPNSSVADSGALKNVTADRSVYAAFSESIYETITDTWAEIIESCADGTYTKYHVGDTKIIDLGTEGQVAMQIVGIATDNMSDDTGKAPLTWISKQLLKTSRRMNPSKQSGTEGTGTLGGWETSEMRSYLSETIKPLIPEVVRNALKSVKKYTRIYDSSETSVSNVLTYDDIWIPSRQEILGDYETSEPDGIYYSTVFCDDVSRMKNKVNDSPALWWFRTAYNTSNFYCINASGAYNNSTARTTNGVALGFCI